MPCFNHRPWETPPQICLKADQCAYLHSDQPIPGHVYSQPKSKSRGKGNRKARPRGGQMFSSVLAMGAVLTGLAAVPTASSLDTFGFSLNEDDLQDTSLVHGSIGRIGVSKSGGLSGALGVHPQLGHSILKGSLWVNGIAGYTDHTDCGHLPRSVDLSSAVTYDIEAVGNMWPVHPSGTGEQFMGTTTKSKAAAKSKRFWTADALKAEVNGEAYIQQR